MRAQRPVQGTEQGDLPRACREVPGRSPQGSRPAERPGRGDAVRPFGEGFRRLEAGELEGAPESQSLPIPGIDVSQEDFAASGAVQGIEGAAATPPGSGRLETAGRNPILGSDVLQSSPEDCRLGHGQRILDGLSGLSGRSDAEERAERIHGLPPEAIHQREFLQGQDIARKGPVIRQGGNLIGRQQAAFQHPFPGCLVYRERAVPIGFQFLQQPVVQVFGAVGPCQIQGRPDRFVGLGGSGKGGAEEHQAQGQFRFHGRKIRDSGGKR